MKAIKYLGFAAAAILMAACSSDNDEPRQPERPATIPFTATIAAPDGATRTTYTMGKNAQDKDIVNVAWKVDDEIALIHGGKLDKLTVQTVNGDGSATVSGTIATPSGGSEDAKLVYPYSSVVKGERTGTNFDYDYSVWNNLYKQTGVLADIATNGLDIREGTGTIVIDGGQGKFGSSVAMTSKMILWKFTLKNSDGSADLSATQLKIEVTHDGYTSIFAKAVKAEASSFYMAVPEEVESLLKSASNTLKITALGSDGNYSYTKNKAMTLSTGKYYESTINMLKASDPNSDYLAATVGNVIGADCKIYATPEAANSASTAMAMIVYVGTESTAFRGLAIALSDEGPDPQQWGTARPEQEQSAVTTVASKSPTPDGATWFLPTVLDWQLILASGKELGLSSSEYWTGTEISSGKAYYYNPETGVYGIALKSNAYNPRACIAF